MAIAKTLLKKYNDLTQDLLKKSSEKNSHSLTLPVIEKLKFNGSSEAWLEF